MLSVALLMLTGCGRDGGDDGTDEALPDPTPVVTEPAEEQTSEPAAPALDPSSVDPCVLVTHEEAEELAQTPLDEARVGPNSCTYTGPPTGPVAQVEIYVGDGAKKVYDIDVSLDHEFTEIPDIGDEAFLEEGMIFFHKQGVWVGIRVFRTEDWSRFEQATIEAARRAADRM